MKKNTTKIPISSEKLPLKKIKWRDAEKELPKIHSARWYSERHSNRVLVCVAFKGFKATYEYRFGVYIKNRGWQIEGMIGNVHVAAWAYPGSTLKNFLNTKKP